MSTPGLGSATRAVLALVAIGGGVALVPELGLTGAGTGVALTRLPVHRRTLAACRHGAAGAPGVTAFADAVRAAAAGISRSPSSRPNGSG
ncbi:MAG TPA: hypothetical protein VD903_22380 [Pseudonocardia sp.]|nr:hypothetical protein [Pseudonocardia sp.]